VTITEALRHLLERVEALEQVPPTPEAAPVATDKELFSAYNAPYGFAPALRVVYNLGRQHGAAQPPAAQPAPPPAPAGGLVRRVLKAMWKGVETSDADGARAAIREVAAWMRENETGFNAARWLEQEADRG